MNIPSVQTPFFFDQFVSGYINDNRKYFDAQTADAALKHFNDSADAGDEPRMNTEQEERFLAVAARLITPERYWIRDRETGNKIASFETIEVAREHLAAYEANDRANGTYTPNFYEIVRV